MPLLGPSGRPIESFKKAKPPKMGPAFGDWAGRDLVHAQLPGGGVLGFDLNRLTIEDFRAMRDNYQINASLSVLSFMMHQIDWRIECTNSKIASMIEANIREMWPRLIRAISQAYWAGYSPIVMEYENDISGRQVLISKFKDLDPLDANVKWKEVKGYAPPGRIPPKFKVYDGIHQLGVGDIPPEHTLWYPLLMENGNYYGKKLLRTAFVPWYFSNLVHLFANRYHERYGEPTPIGRAPFDADVEAVQGGMMTGKQSMDEILMNLRNRAAVTLPSDRDSTTKEYEWDIKYLESQMRGADFERYLSRLDEEMSLGIFTPVLLFRTSESGSYNLGVGHMQLFMWMLNALAGDMKEYIDRYVVNRLKDYNFGANAPKAQWQFRDMGKENVETVRAMLTELVRQDKARPDLDELGQIAGLTMHEVRQVTGDDDTPDPDDPDVDRRTNRDRGTDDTGPRGIGQPRATTREISNRVSGQVTKAWRDRSFGPDFQPSFGYKRRFESALRAEGASEDQAAALTEQFFTRVEDWAREAINLGTDSYAGPEDFMSMVNRVMETELENLVR